MALPHVKEEHEMKVRAPEGDRFIPSRRASNNEHQFCDVAPSNERERMLSRAVGMSLTDHHHRALQFKCRTYDKGHVIFPTFAPVVASIRKQPIGSSKAIQKSDCRRLLSAPGLKMDYYTHPLDWSSQNVLATAANNGVYLKNMNTEEVSGLACDNDVSSVAFSRSGAFMSVGSRNGHVSLWDVQQQTLIRSWDLHNDKATTTLCWHPLYTHLITSGGKDGTVFMTDARSAHSWPQLMANTGRSGICGLQWSPDGKLLACGDNNNVVRIRSSSKQTIMTELTKGGGAMRALCWAPHGDTLLTGGGTDDRMVRVWNVNSPHVPLLQMDMGFQITNLLWSASSSNVSHEIIVTGGFYPHDKNGDRIVRLQYTKNWSSNKKVHTWNTGQTDRVLFAVSGPDELKFATNHCVSETTCIAIWNAENKRHAKNTKPAFVMHTIR